MGRTKKTGSSSGGAQRKRTNRSGNSPRKERFHGVQSLPQRKRRRRDRGVSDGKDLESPTLVDQLKREYDYLDDDTIRFIKKTERKCRTCQTYFSVTQWSSFSSFHPETLKDYCKKCEKKFECPDCSPLCSECKYPICVDCLNYKKTNDNYHCGDCKQLLCNQCSRGIRRKCCLSLVSSTFPSHV